MMNNSLLLFERAKMFSALSGTQIIFVENMLGDGNHFWFICPEFTPSNPSNHIHYNELIRAKCINTMMMNNNQYDKDLFNTQLENIIPSRIIFPSFVKWLKII